MVKNLKQLFLALNLTIFGQLFYESKVLKIASLAHHIKMRKTSLFLLMSQSLREYVINCELFFGLKAAAEIICDQI